MVDSFVNRPERDPSLAYWVALGDAYGRGDAADFNRELAAYQGWLEKHDVVDAGKMSFETVINHFEPFYQCMVLYVCVFLLAVFSWLGWSRPLGRAALGLMIVALTVHTASLIARIYLQGRPPVTNLYSSAIFIGWACIVAGLVLDLLSPLRIGTIIGSVSGFLSLLVAHFLTGDGDTMEVMQAVLDTNFWLATHVVCITIGYAATFFAGGLATMYIVLGLATKSLNREMSKTLARMMYGVVCFAMLFSFVGTVLGGIWADQFVGTVLGLGYQRERRPVDRNVECRDLARPLGRHGPSARHRHDGYRGQHHYRLVPGSA